MSRLSSSEGFVIARQYRDENKKLRAALKFYADERNWLNDREIRGFPGYHGRTIAERALSNVVSINEGAL